MEKFILKELKTSTFVKLVKKQNPTKADFLNYT